MAPDTGLERSRWVDLDGPVHYLDYGGPADGPAIVCVHGLGGAAVNWSAVAPLLTGRCRVLAPDLLGHGLSFARGRHTAVPDNRALLHRFVREVVGRPVILMGNSMGGMISLLQAVAEPADVAGLVLVAPAVPLVPTRPDPLVAAMFAAYGTPLVGPSVLAARRRFVTPERNVDLTLRLCTADVSRVPADVVQEHYTVARARASYRDTGREFLGAARSVLRTGADLRRTAYRHTIRGITAPVLVFHGDKDRLISLASVRAAVKANPAWQLVLLDDAGHVPQLEWPRKVADGVLDWLDTAGQGAARTASDRDAPR